MSVLTTKCLEKRYKNQKSNNTLSALEAGTQSYLPCTDRERVDEFDNPHMDDVSQLLLPNCNSVDYSSMNHYYYFFYFMIWFYFFLCVLS
jgi:hypothetical protein